LIAIADLFETNTKEFKLQCTNQYSAKDINQFYHDYQKLIQSFNLIQYAVQEQIKIMRKGFKKKRHNQFYTGSPQGLHPVFSAPLAKKVPLTQLIVHIQLINQFLLPVEIKNPAKLINCSPQLPINFSRNTRLTQFLLPVEIKNPAKLINCSPQLPINFSRNTRLTPIAQTNTIVQ